MNTNPFLAPGRQAELYGDASRLAGRSHALMRAKTSGRPVPDTVVQLVEIYSGNRESLGLVVDIGCGRGPSTRFLAEQLRPARIIGLDAAPALIAVTGLDPKAEQRESLYTSAHSGNLADLANVSLEVIAADHEEHRFTFAGHDHAAEYLATNPKYDLAPGLYGHPGALAAALQASIPDRPITTSSTITYVVARPRGDTS